MKEFSFQIRDFKGLRPDSRIPRNAPNFSDECYNTRVGPFGLEPYEGITQPYIGMPTLAFPFPQAVFTLDGRYLVTDTTIYYVNADNTLTEVLGSLTGVDQWQLADFGLYQLWSNGRFMLERDDHRMFTVKGTATSIGTICNFRGQLIAGNFGDGYLNFIAWSDIGRLGDITKLLQPEGNSKNTAGFMPLRLSGTVLTVKELDEAVIAYCTSGVVLLPPVTSPVVTFGQKIVSTVGLIARDAIAGDLHRHIYVGVDQKVYEMVSGKPVPKELGYKEYITTLTSADIVVSLDPQTGDFYISDGTKGFLLSPYGMSTIMDYPTSVGRVSGVLTGVRIRSADVTAYNISTMVDFGMAAIKMITGVHVSGEGTSMTVGINYRFGVSGAFTLSTMKPINSLGFAAPIVSGNQLKVKVMSTAYATFKLDELNVRWKLSDKRGIRGIYDASSKNA
jgi:hypothetical protein